MKKPFLIELTVDACYHSVPIRIHLTKVPRNRSDNWCRCRIQFNCFRGQLIQDFRNVSPFTSKICDCFFRTCLEFKSTLTESLIVMKLRFELLIVMKCSNNLNRIKMAEENPKIPSSDDIVCVVMNVH